MTHRTALDLSEEEWKSYHPLQVILDRQSATQAHVAKRRRRAVRLAKQAAVLLRRNFNAQRVVAFGSLAKRGGFTQWSDIDLAAWGISPDEFYKAVAVVTGLSTDFKIDLVDANTCRPSLRAAIERDGKDI